MTRRAVVAVCALGLLLPALTGCGSSRPPALDPAAAVPKGAALYLEATLEPTASLHRALQAVGARLLANRHPLQSLYRLLDFGARRLRPSAAQRFVGAKAGLFLTAVPPLEERSGSAFSLVSLLRDGLAGSLFRQERTPPGAVVFDLVDGAAARSYIHAVAVGEKGRTVAFGGATVTVLPDGEAATTDHGYLLVGNLLGVERALEAVLNRSALRQQGSFSKLRATPTAGPVAALYLYLAKPAALPGNKGTAGAAAPPYARELVGPPGSALYLTASVNETTVRVESDRLPGSAATDSPSANESELAGATQQLFAALPEAAWLAVALENLPDALHKAETAAPLLALVGLKVPPTPSVASLLQALGQAGGSIFSPLLDPLAKAAGTLAGQPAALRRALAGWLGPAALYIAGSSLVELNGALEISCRAETRCKEAVGRLGAILKGGGFAVKPDTESPVSPALAIALPTLPGGLALAASNGKFVAGLGASPLQNAFSPQGTLGSASALRQATAGLGEGLAPRLLVAFPQLTSVLGLLGADSNPTLSPLLPRLYALSTLALAVGRSGPVQRTVALLDLSP